MTVLSYKNFLCTAKNNLITIEEKTENSIVRRDVDFHKIITSPNEYVARMVFIAEYRHWKIDRKIFIDE